MRRLPAAAFATVSLAVLAGASPPQLTQDQRDATHAMFEHVVNTPTVIGRHKTPEMTNFVADQFKAAGFPAEDVHVLPYHTESATTGGDDTAAVIVRWRAPGKSNLKPIMLMGHMDVFEA
jgi:acetylornithine deacetylase/succinyl-diaminopimelate desuccinylase-like protein